MQLNMSHWVKVLIYFIITSVFHFTFFFTVRHMLRFRSVIGAARSIKAEMYFLNVNTLFNFILKGPTMTGSSLFGLPRYVRLDGAAGCAEVLSSCWRRRRRRRGCSFVSTVNHPRRTFRSLGIPQQQPLRRPPGPTVSGRTRVRARGRLDGRR